MSQHIIHFWQGRTEAAYRDVVRLQQENAALAAENERLRKAGDAMAFNYEQMHSHDGVYDSDLMKYVSAWAAAKEGAAK